MIARISLAAEALADLTGGYPPAASKALHEALARILEAHGILLLADREEMHEILDAVRAIGTTPPGVKDRWLLLLAEFGKRKRIQSLGVTDRWRLSHSTAMDEIHGRLAGRARIAIVPSGQAASLGANSSGLLFDSNLSIELASASAVAYCNTINDIQNSMNRGELAYGADREVFWTEVLGPICSVSRTITIVDQYLYAGLFRDSNHAGPSGVRQPEFIGWLLGHLDKSALSGTELRLIARTGYRNVPGDISVIARKIDRSWSSRSNGRLTKVEIVGGVSGSMPHDRHVRASIGVAVKLLAGFDRLSKTTISDRDGMGWQYLWDGKSIRRMRATEERVLSAQGTRTVSL